MSPENIRALEPKEQSGSRPRCLLLTDGDDRAVAARLHALVSPFATITAGKHRWAPGGFARPREIELDKAEGFLEPKVRRILREWWLAKPLPISKTPTWDIVASADVQGKEGLVLVEAKAHHAELSIEGKEKRSPLNDASIAGCIMEASHALNVIGSGWNLSCASHYQLANRFTWAWKLATLGIPVVLLYLGFLKADEMASPSRRPILDEDNWRSLMSEYGRGLVPESAWSSAIDVGGVPLIGLRRVTHIDLPES